MDDNTVIGLIEDDVRDIRVGTVNVLLKDLEEPFRSQLREYNSLKAELERLRARVAAMGSVVEAAKEAVGYYYRDSEKGTDAMEMCSCLETGLAALESNQL